MNRHITLYLLAFCSLAVCASLIYCPTPARAADILLAKESGRQPAPAQKPSSEPQGHQMRRYQAFARQAELPPVKVTSESTIEVGETVKADTSRLAQLSIQEKESLVNQFRVPAGLIERLVQRVPNAPQPSAAQFAQELRTAVIDYRFLQGEWGRYHPQAEGQKTKADALAALQAGDIARAWALYDELSKPQPPTNLRVVAGP